MRRPRLPHGSAGRRHCVETQQPTRLVGGRTGDDDVTAQRREIGFQSLQPLNVAEQHPRLDGIDGRTQLGPCAEAVHRHRQRTDERSGDKGDVYKRQPPGQAPTARARRCESCHAVASRPGRATRPRPWSRDVRPCTATAVRRPSMSTCAQRQGVGQPKSAPAPVSYTHLDVYKRQRPACSRPGRRRPCS